MVSINNNVSNNGFFGNRFFRRWVPGLVNLYGLHPGIKTLTGLQKHPITIPYFGGMIGEQDQLVKIYGKTITLDVPSSPLVLYQAVNEKVNEMFTVLETKGLMTDESVFEGNTARVVLQTLVDESVKNGVEAVARKWASSNNSGSEISVIAFTENGKLWIQVLDNGDGFQDAVLEKAGKESLAGVSPNNESAFTFTVSLNDHLFKMGQLAILLNWDLVVKNRDNGGGNVSIGVPLY